MSTIIIEIDGGQGELEHNGEYYSATGSASYTNFDGWVEIEDTDLLICLECGEGSTIIKRKSKTYHEVEEMVKTKAKEAAERGENRIFG
jgi:hypothetical protein